MINHTGIQFIIHHYFLYDNSLSDILINYSLIILFTFINNFHNEDLSRSLANIHSAVFLLLQVLCWLLLEAYGVSLVWSGQLGLTLLLLLDMTRRKEKLPGRSSLLVRSLSGLAGLLAVIYYAYW